MEYVNFGLLHRHEDSTKIHSHSSRSHLIVQLNIYQMNIDDSSKLTVDVADVTSGKKLQNIYQDQRKRARYHFFSLSLKLQVPFFIISFFYFSYQ